MSDKVNKKVNRLKRELKKDYGLNSMFFVMDNDEDPLTVNVGLAIEGDTKHIVSGVSSIIAQDNDIMQIIELALKTAKEIKSLNNN